MSNRNTSASRVAARVQAPSLLLLASALSHSRVIMVDPVSRARFPSIPETAAFTCRTGP